ncbi:MAG: hypothetical protein HYX34_14725 [Actinobacteria bacterium]|nr:hypothetical protein [Actinomycetota bacterium]
MPPRPDPHARRHPSARRSPPPDDRLLAAARAGDDTAFAELLERNDALLLTLVYRLLDGHGAEDVLAEAYVKAYRALGRQRGPAKPWLARRVYLAALEEVDRRERRRRGGPGRKPVTEPVPPAPDAGPLGSLPPDQRAVVVLVDETGVPLPEVAMVLGAPVETVGNLLARARRALAAAQERPAGRPPGEPAREPGHGPGHEPAREPGHGPGHEPDVPPVPPAPEVSLTEALTRPAKRGPDRPVTAHDPARQPADLVLPPPQHSPGFWSGLGARLLAERERPALPTPILRPEQVAALGAAPPPDDATGARRSAGPGRDRVAALASSGGPPPRRPRPSGRALAVTALLLVVAAGVAKLLLAAAEARSPVRHNSVAELAGRVNDALARADGFTARMERVDVTPSGRRVDETYLLAERSDGSYVLAGPRAVAYDAAANVRWSRRSTPGRPPEVLEQRGLATGSPDPGPGDVALPDDDLGLAIRALVQVRDEAGQRGRVAGRPAWTLRGPLPDRGGRGDPDRVELSVDEGALVPLRLRFLAGSRLVRELRFDGASFDRAVAGPFRVDGAGASLRTVDEGFRPAEVVGVESAIGYEPPRPAWLPAGYELDRAAVSNRGGVVSLRYARGLQAVVLSLRRSPVAAGTPWPDPFDRRGRTVRRDRLTLERGRFRGVVVQRVSQLGARPSLWGSDGDLAFTVSGDLARDDLVRVAESLR